MVQQIKLFMLIDEDEHETFIMMKVTITKD